MSAAYNHAYSPVNRENLVACDSHLYMSDRVSLADRLTARMKKQGLSQAELARRVKVSQPTINALATGGSQSSAHLHKIARALETTVDWLEGLTDDPGPDAVPAVSREMLAEQLGLELVPELDIGFSMGGGSVTADFPRIGFRAFDRDFLARIARGNPASLFVAQGEGDSMQPTLMHEDSVLIDTSEKEINKQDRIWALAYGDLGMIKRVRRLPGGRFLILSDNATILPFEAADEEMHVIGRVVWIGRRI